MSSLYNLLTTIELVPSYDTSQQARVRDRPWARGKFTTRFIAHRFAEDDKTNDQLWGRDGPSPSLPHWLPPRGCVV